ncbi:hypothetical protein DMX08_06205 [Pseudomonas protegens]|uniref:Uncharacterized protein n=1 Tax=Pseudomonas protegens TaxID=380021 RepID=A0A9Q6N9F5_9PSED|nr:hypothetical protein DMX08_06205 [Pseudomonas protegens]
MTPCSYGRDTQTPCRSRLAGEEARKPCIALKDLFAGKPAPTGARAGHKALSARPTTRTVPRHESNRQDQRPLLRVDGRP